MRKPALPAFIVGVVFLVAAGTVVGVRAQEGHPLKGTWSGDWGPNLDDRRHLTVVMDYDGEADGEAIEGLLNPGPNGVALSGVQLDVTSWTVRIEGETPAGEPIRAEGQIENLESYHRTISGTWRQGNVEGAFTLTRD
jgi:hypothetical protein